MSVWGKVASFPFPIPLPPTSGLMGVNEINQKSTTSQHGSVITTITLEEKTSVHKVVPLNSI